ncbi:hypothetical protein GCM10011297_04210 [Bacterioplanes sanyensis]|uniref:DUF3570 domain-containing protein n=1 Tax=Bacterioplanes sanyensis TaxID=1249553 RepID=UPI00167C192A|nr:DUF3570 domain-containing protein [Bacterioplanes sanyensis]GGY34329.1 hypothetical protein GCM10011297_04210 [Bacterioplanes sanyensis]
MNKTLSTLAALSSAAAAMPAQAAAVPTDTVSSYRYSQYREADAPASRVYAGDIERYSIDVHQLHHARPLAEQWYVSGDVQYETLSGASPWKTYQNTDDQSVLIMSGASGEGITDTRIDINSQAKRYFDEGTLGGQVGVSHENDYQSLALGGDGSLELFDKHTTLTLAFSTSFDRLSPTDAEQYGGGRSRADGRSKRTTSTYHGISQVLDARRVISAGIGYTHHSGFLSDPYKLDDRRPGERDQFTLDGQYRHHFDVFAGAAAHLDYRLYQDDWGINSHTLSVRWSQAFQWGQWRYQVTPLLRYYRQTAANFYNLEELPPADDYASSDARLSSFGAITAGLHQRLSWQQWSVSLDYQTYQSDEQLTLISTTEDEAPGLVDFSIFSLGLEYRH